MADHSPDASLTQDESFVPTSYRGLDYPLGAFAPARGELHRLSAGLRWARISLPGSLGHINCWVLDDEDGVAICDTGMSVPACVEDWESIFAGELADIRVTRILGTHFHPDHIGLAGWLADRFDAPVWMTRGEWLTAQLSRADARDAVPADVIALRRAAGWSADQIAASLKRGWGRMRNYVTQMPLSYRRLQDGDRLTIGPCAWTVVTGNGHSPEHACLLNARDGLLIAGDQVLPRISSNVSLSVTEPEGDPLGDWLSSIDKLLALPEDVLVLPAHGEPFRGLHTRLTALRDEHLGQLDALAGHLAEPRRAVDCFGLLFSRAIGEDALPLASGEALSHLRHLEVTGRAVREVSDDAIWWYRAA